MATEPLIVLFRSRLCPRYERDGSDLKGKGREGGRTSIRKGFQAFQCFGFVSARMCVPQ